jgi:hypothetical protein
LLLRLSSGDGWGAGEGTAARRCVSVNPGVRSLHRRSDLPMVIDWPSAMGHNIYPLTRSLSR